MRILLTADAEIPVPPRLYGGIERIIASLLEEYRRLGHTVGLVAHADSPVATDFFAPWPGLTSTARLDSVRNAAALSMAVRTFKPDVLHSFSRLLWLWPLKLIAPGLSIVMSYQREPTGGTIRRTRTWFGDQQIQFTGCSEYIAGNGRTRGGGRWTGIPNFIDLEKFTFSPNVSDDAPLVFLSRIEAIKGVDRAIEMARQANKRLIIAGNRIDSDEGKRYWDEQIEPHLGNDGIDYVGPVDDAQKNQLLGSAAALLVPITWNEPFGIVFVEALACGTPVISSPRGALPSIVEEGAHGFLVNSIDDGVAAINRLGMIDRYRCRKHGEEHFSSSVVAERYLDLYRQSVSRSGGGAVTELIPLSG